MEKYIIWLILMVVFLIIEAITMGLTTIWFAAGAFIAMLLSLLGLQLWIQIAAFLIITILCLIFLYPFFRNKFRIGIEKTNFETVIGKNGIVIEAIDNMKSSGQVKVDGQIWSARSNAEEIIEVGKKVLIEEVKGVKLIVKESA